MDLDTTITRLTAGARAAKRPCWREDTLRLGYHGELMKGSRGDDEDAGRRDVFFHSPLTVDDLQATDYELVDCRVCFVSGHLDVTVKEFMEHYAPALQKAFDAGDSFVVGDADGTDVRAQVFLDTRIKRSRKPSGDEGPEFDGTVTVYHMLVAPRHNPAGFPTVGGFLSDTERDAALTEASDYDVAWVRPGREKKSGTARNLKRRAVKDAKKKETT